MPIDRTAFNAIVEEPLGGDGTTGDRWTKALIASAILDPIDAAIAALGAAVPIYSNWTPNDASGASLTFTGVSAHYIRIDKLYICSFELVYPTQSNGAAARIGGLPATVGSVPTNGWTGMVGYTESGLDFRFLAFGTSLFPYKTDGSQPTNANLSAKSVRGLAIFKST